MTGATVLPNSNKVRVVLPADPVWQKYLNTLPHDFYHLPGYLELEAQRYGAKAEAIVIQLDAEVFFLPYLVRDCDLHGDPVYDVISPYGYPGMLVSPAGQNPQFIDRCLQTIYRYWQERNICSGPAAGLRASAEKKWRAAYPTAASTETPRAPFANRASKSGGCPRQPAR